MVSSYDAEILDIDRVIGEIIEKLKVRIRRQIEWTKAFIQTLSKAIDEIQEMGISAVKTAAMMGIATSSMIA